MHRLVWFPLLLGSSACFNPSGSDETSDGSTGGSASDSTSAASSATTQTTSGSTTSATSSTSVPTATDPTDTASSTTDPTTDGTQGGTGSTGGGSTGEFVPGCDNGVVEDDELCYGEAVEIDTLVSTQGVAVGYVDDDNHLDVVVGDYGNGTTGALVVYLGLGDGNFGAAIPSDDSFPIIRVAVGPIADGTPDVVALRADATSGLIRFRGDGDGTFSTVTTYAGASSWDVALADFNGDDRLDALGTTNALELWLANATEGYAFDQDIATIGGGSFGCVQVANLDGDSDLDVVGCGSTGIVVVFNEGGLSFTQAEAFGATGNDIVIGDFDGDDDNDLANLGDSTVRTFFNDGDGSFSAGPEPTVNSSPIAGKSSDVDGDGFDDIIVVNTSGTTSILLSNGDGTFQSQQLYTMIESYLYDMDMGDLNEDGVDDIVVVAPNGGPIQMLLSHI